MKTRLLGIDHGDSRIGLAISDELGSFAHPYRTLQASGPVIEEIRAIVEREQISGIIIGLPKNMDGTLGASAAKPTATPSRASALKRIAKRAQVEVSIVTDSRTPEAPIWLRDQPVYEKSLTLARLRRPFT